ncbi:hypothetical protein TruAng_003266 [Truncatella angustata]|nr:hypothetical protein TruAng_003266 [Truncatella angustata]
MTSLLPEPEICPSPSKPSPSAREVQYDFNSSAPVTPRAVIDPPRLAKEGFEWVWFPEGYWAERERVDFISNAKFNLKWRNRSQKSSSGQTEKSGSGDRFSPTDNLHHLNPKDPISRAAMLGSNAPLPSPFLSEADHVLSLQRPSLERGTSEESKFTDSPWVLSRAAMYAGKVITSSPLSLTHESPLYRSSNETTRPATVNRATSIQPTENLVKKSPMPSPFQTMKSIMGLKPKTKEHKLKRHPTNTSNYTASTIAGATSQLENHSHGGITRVPSLLRDRDDAGSPSNGHKSRQRKLFGLAPWQRRFSKESVESVSSSIREMIRGHTPNSSPASDFLTIKSCRPDDRDEMYPGNEARRIRTPPLRTPFREAGVAYSFFTETIPPDANNRAPVPPRAVEPPKLKTAEEVTGSLHQQKLKPREWWEVPAATLRWERMGRKPFEFNLPEHLPTSPMCPANKKYKSGGTEVCVYHGRRKRSSQLETSDGEDSLPRSRR